VFVVLASGGLGGTAAAGGGATGDGAKRLDDVRVLGTHNSYHLRPARELVPGEPADYAHAPIDVQLDEQGIRSLELDTYNGPTFPVFHSLVVDTESSCPTMEACLDTINTWSRAHPKHDPLILFVEPKPLPTSDNPTVQEVIATAAADQSITEWDAAGLDRLDTLVRDTFGNQLITPDEVRGDRKTLRGAVMRDGWPTLAKSRGRVLVTLIGEPEIRALYKADAPSLEGRAMFVDSHPSEPSAAVVTADVPERKRFQRRLRQHFLIKTRADADGKEARANDHTRADAALASGAQVVVTDYPVADPLIGPYVVALP
jgi:hypothetical protein